MSWKTRAIRASMLALLLIAGGCEEDEPTKPEPEDDPFTGNWLGTWSVTTEVDWASGLGCPEDAIVSRLVVIQEGDDIKDLLEQIAPPALEPYVEFLVCGMKQEGNAIGFSDCGFVGTPGGCFVSTSLNGSGSAEANSFTVTMDATYQVSAPCEPVDCTFFALSTADRVVTKSRPGWLARLFGKANTP